jgi:hypothetical protein
MLVDPCSTSSLKIVLGFVARKIPPGNPERLNMSGCETAIGRQRKFERPGGSGWPGGTVQPRPKGKLAVFDRESRKEMAAVWKASNR